MKTDIRQKIVITSKGQKDNVNLLSQRNNFGNFGDIELRTKKKCNITKRETKNDTEYYEHFLKT